MGLLGESRKLCYARLIYVDRVLFNKISFYENHKCPCVASAKCLCPKTKIYAFSFENTKLLTCCHICIRITYTVQVGNLYFVELFEKGFGNTQEEKMFLSLCNVECIYFWWFSKHGWNLLFFVVLISENRGVVSIDVLFRNVGNKFVWSSWENSLLKKCGCSRCQALWLVGENSWAFM